MNKYQVALEWLCENSELTKFNINQSQWASETLHELVDKATPKRVVGLSITYDGLVGNCPSCKKFVRQQDSKPNLCECTQQMDWSEDE